jgi:hypothetical protein
MMGMTALDYLPILNGCADRLVVTAVCDAVARLFDRDRRLLELDAKEEAIAHALAAYLAPHFNGLDVDVEYNRMGPDPKRVAWDGALDLVYPDIIVHIRDSATNVLAIELKKGSNHDPKDDDILKLRAYRRELGYLHALFLRLGVGKSAGCVLECEWVDP